MVASKLRPYLNKQTNECKKQREGMIKEKKKQGLEETLSHFLPANLNYTVTCLHKRQTTCTSFHLFVSLSYIMNHELIWRCTSL